MARLLRRGALVCMAILAMWTLAACGGGTSTSDKNAYAKKVNAAQTKFAETVTTVSGQGGSKTNSIRQQQATLVRFQTAIEGVVKELRAIDAPPEATKEHERLTAVMAGFGKAIGDAGKAMRNPTPSGIELAKRSLATATQTVNARVNAAIAAINLKLRGK
jgi:phage-related tail protein